jgi:hypothetical protein
MATFRIMTANTAEDLYDLVRQLSAAERLRLVEKIAHDLSAPLANAAATLIDSSERDARSARTVAPVEAPASEEREYLIQRQYDEANKFPGEFVVLVGTRVLVHSVDRDEAVGRYESASADAPEGMPVLIEPGLRGPDRDPVVRARSQRELGARTW